jgi:precorrin-6x reductase
MAKNLDARLRSLEQTVKGDGTRREYDAAQLALLVWGKTREEVGPPRTVITEPGPTAAERTFAMWKARRVQEAAQGIAQRSGGNSALEKVRAARRGTPSAVLDMERPQRRNAGATEYYDEI